MPWIGSCLQRRVQLVKTSSMVHVFTNGLGPRETTHAHYAVAKYRLEDKQDIYINLEYVS